MHPDVLPLISSEQAQEALEKTQRVTGSRMSYVSYPPIHYSLYSGAIFAPCGFTGQSRAIFFMPRKSVVFFRFLHHDSWTSYVSVYSLGSLTDDRYEGLCSDISISSTLARLSELRYVADFLLSDNSSCIPPPECF